MEEAGHICVPLNLGETRRIPSGEYECVRNGSEYVLKLAKYALRGYVFHVHTNGDSLKGFVLNLIAYGISLLTFRRPVLTIHAGTDQTYFPREKSRLMVPLFKFLFTFAKAVICDNREVARKIVEYGVSPEKVFPISPFTRQYLESPAETLNDDLDAFLKVHTPVILTYLECRPEYDLDSLFKAVGQVALRESGMGLIVIGAKGDEARIHGLATAAGLADRCLHLGSLDRTAFLSLLRRVSVYLRSARTEGTSASIREALHFGVPVVANCAASHPKGVTTYPWGNAAAMFETLLTVLETPRVAQQAPPPSQALDVPDTVPEEVAVLVRSAHGVYSIRNSPL